MVYTARKVLIACILVTKYLESCIYSRTYGVFGRGYRVRHEGRAPVFLSFNNTGRVKGFGWFGRKQGALRAGQVAAEGQAGGPGCAAGRGGFITLSRTHC
jgi:hypothetical protein